MIADHIHEDFDTPSVSVPTNTLVGSEERVEVYANRFALGLPIFNPNDSTESIIERPNLLNRIRNKSVFTVNIQKKYFDDYAEGNL